MTNTEIEVVKKLMRKSITKTEFLQDFTVDVTQNSGYVLMLLERAYNRKIANEVEYSLFIAFSFNLFNEDYVEIACKLIESHWHFQHENLAMILQRLKSPASIEYLYRAAVTQFDYLDFDEAYALAVKCIWALGDINTEDSRGKLKLLTESENEIIRENAVKQLERNN
ncbi:hypothetical protein HQN87_23085 [Paenibacillus tritici]|uniref:HEAT repeat domain-containing protein n=1 Tax=Paenibacillus tritici TaxID=1873425 RepID=A0ABX2DXT4_9BACL|nr:HEAT repeat domain-containing protein [Paenibacillus tritici]NQX48216.1 hypothetical protein [Paenibacillus tritici]